MIFTEQVIWYVAVFKRNAHGGVIKLGATPTAWATLYESHHLLHKNLADGTMDYLFRYAETLMNVEHKAVVLSTSPAYYIQSPECTWMIMWYAFSG